MVAAMTETQLQITPVTPENRNELLRLAVAPEQSGFIETVVECLAEAEGLALWKPVGIYDKTNPVGFAMYGFFPQEGHSGRLWLDRLLIDYRYQGKGFGLAAMELLLARLETEFGKQDIYLSLYDGNLPAERLYTRFGFVRNGELDIHGEKVMVRTVQ